MLVRRITAQDSSEWMRLRRALWPEHTAEEHLIEMRDLSTDPACATFVAVRPNGGLGGFLEAGIRKYAEGSQTSPVGYIEGWYVDNDLRQLGIGRRLVQAAEVWALENGLSEMASDCLTDNEISQRAHLALGYKEVERLIHFIKPLSSNSIGVTQLKWEKSEK
ncbi:MAG TPA: aminoglycoside 6'-N-acetyltransferase [Anaerolineales bacterium]|nr:aminoglycoside 6'-N-acetyltransferase [Anaerolineales bacterium]